MWVAFGFRLSAIGQATNNKLIQLFLLIFWPTADS
jgi:hypothetical protein